MSRAGVVTLPRTGAPPLRLKARRAARYTARRGAARAEVGLWQRGEVGWAVALALEAPQLPGHGRRCSAMAVATLEEGCAFLEAAVAQAERAPVPPTAQGAPWRMAVSRLSARVAVAQARDAIAAVAGAALAEWTDAEVALRLADTSETQERAA